MRIGAEEGHRATLYAAGSFVLLAGHAVITEQCDYAS